MATRAMNKALCCQRKKTADLRRVGITDGEGGQAMTIHSDETMQQQALRGYLADRPEGVSSPQIAEAFFHLTNPTNLQSMRFVQRVLSGQECCVQGPDGLWRLRFSSADSVDLVQMPWRVLSCGHRSRQDAFHMLSISVWKPLPEPLCQVRISVIHPQTGEASRPEMFTNDSTSPSTVQQLVSALNGCITIYGDYAQYQLLNAICRKYGSVLPEGVLLASQLLRLCAIQSPSPFNLNEAFKAVFGRSPSPEQETDDSLCLCTIVGGILKRMKKRGITTQRELDRKDLESIAANHWPSLVWSDICIGRISQQHGVFGFQDETGAFIYCGRARNLKLRLTSLLRLGIDEGPKKLLPVRKDAVRLMLYECGSELESQLLEYRLLKKHAPRYNTPVVAEVNDSVDALQDCIIVLPHAVRLKCMSVWCRGRHRILLKTIDITHVTESEIQSLLSSFFTGHESTLQEQSQPSERIQVQRWMRQQSMPSALIGVDPCVSFQDIAGKVVSACCHIGSHDGQPQARDAAGLGKPDREVLSDDIV
ncbi:MAG: nucleotide excision repair endonuclease [Chitinivibrionales bacterium]|nr:nucleotide excision repair endonuclease [Chitinivibrionales bacterium]